jgi:hypothetical protein
MFEYIERPSVLGELNFASHVIQVVTNTVILYKLDGINILIQNNHKVTSKIKKDEYNQQN